MNLLDILKKIGSFAKRAFGIAQERGLTDDMVKLALELVQQAQTQFADSAAKREWVVSALQAAGLPESIARLAVELAVQLWKKQAPSPTA